MRRRDEADVGTTIAPGARSVTAPPAPPATHAPPFVADLVHRDPPPTPAQSDRCPACGATRATRYCGECGERRLARDDFALRTLAGELVESVLSVEARLPRALALLVARPGALTAEWVWGARGRATRPLQLFLLVNVLFFLVARPLGIFGYRLPRVGPGVQPRTAIGAVLQERFVASGMSAESFAAHAQSVLDARMPAMFGLYVLAVAVALHAAHLMIRLVRRRGVAPRPAVVHLVFALHAVAFTMLVQIAAFAALRGFGGPLARAGVPPMVAFVAVLLTVHASSMGYTALGVRRAFGDSWPAALVTALVVGAVLLRFGVVYHRAVSWATVLTL